MLKQNFSCFQCQTSLHKDKFEKISLIHNKFEEISKLSNKFERHYQLGKKFETNLKHKLIHKVKHVLCFSINRMLIYNDIYHRMIDISICTIHYTLRKTIDFIVSWLVIQSVYIVNTLSTHTRLRLTKKFESLLTSYFVCDIDYCILSFTFVVELYSWIYYVMLWV